MIDYNRGKYAYEVIGVTRGVRYYGLKKDPRPEVFIPHAQNAYLPMNLVVRTTSRSDATSRGYQGGSSRPGFDAAGKQHHHNGTTDFAIRSG